MLFPTSIDIELVPGERTPASESSPGMFQRAEIRFRPLQNADLPQMFQWLRNPSVSRWYGPTPDSLAEVESKYLSRISGEDPVRCFIVSYEDRPVGYIQTYRIDHDPEYAASINVDRDAAGVDLFIGDDAFRYRGFGSVMLREFVRRVVFHDPGISCCVIAPTVSNHSAISAYSKAGFRHIKTVPVPDEDEPEYVMMLWPDELDELIEEDGETPSR
jgi:RimJ/RimL family protein N-acetyltransferase